MKHIRTLTAKQLTGISIVDCFLNFLIDITLASEIAKTCKASTVENASQGTD